MRCFAMFAAMIKRKQIMKNLPKVLKYIDPMVDFGFKKIFKESGKKHLIIRPLNAFFDLNIVDIEIRESELLGLTDEERKASFDMYCTTQDNQSFIIEVQLAQQEFFMERAIFYSSLTIAHNAKRGPWDFHVQPVFFLGLLNFDLRHLEPEKANPDQFIHKFSLREDSTHEHMSRALRFAFLEIARFDKTQEECNSFEDKFLYMMKNLPTFVETPELWDDDYFHEMMQEAEYANMTEQERWEYALAMKHKWDYQNTIDFAREEGREEGKIDVAKEMLADKVPVETIIKYTGLTEEQVRAL